MRNTYVNEMLKGVLDLLLERMSLLLVGVRRLPCELAFLNGCNDALHERGLLLHDASARDPVLMRREIEFLEGQMGVECDLVRPSERTGCDAATIVQNDLLADMTRLALSIFQASRDRALQHSPDVCQSAKRIIQKLLTIVCDGAIFRDGSRNDILAKTRSALRIDVGPILSVEIKEIDYTYGLPFVLDDLASTTPRNAPVFPC